MMDLEAVPVTRLSFLTRLSHCFREETTCVLTHIQILAWTKNVLLGWFCFLLFSNQYLFFIYFNKAPSYLRH